LSTVDGTPRLRDEVRRRGVVRRADLARAGVPLEKSDVVEAGEWLVDRAQWARWGADLLRAVDAWAAGHPLEPGMPRRAAVSSVGLPDDALLDALVAAEPDLRLDARGLHRADVAAVLPSEVAQHLQQLIDRLGADPFDVPEAYELQELGLTEKVLAVAAREGRLIRIAPGIYVRPEAVDAAAARLEELDQPFTASAARAALGTTRRIALPLLEHLDRIGRTRRIDPQLRTVRVAAGTR
jgi:selenocysteine-specific elongation factor